MSEQRQKPVFRIRGRPFCAPAVLWPALLALVLPAAAGCRGLFAGPRVEPVFRARRAPLVRPGIRPQEAMAVLPNGGLASVHLHHVHRGGRVWFFRLGVINHYPDRAELSPGRTRVYVDDGEPVRIHRYRAFIQDRPFDDRMLEGAPDEARGAWLFLRRRWLTHNTVRGPTVVLFYGVEGHDGFVKIQFDSIWDVHK